MKKDKRLYEELMNTATLARRLSYSPYSGFSVGAALLTESGKVYTGANIENSGYSATVCAERVAFFRAIAEGEREFSAIAIAGGKGDTPDHGVAPCGVCRQVMTEFCRGDFEIVLLEDGVSVYTLDGLMPKRFEKKLLG